MNGLHTVRFECPSVTCGSVSRPQIVEKVIRAPWPDPSNDDTSVVTFESYSVQCPRCHTVYDVEVKATLSSREAEISGYPGTSVSLEETTHLEDMADGWEIPSPHPYAIFSDALEEVRFMLRELNAQEEPSQ